MHNFNQIPCFSENFINGFYEIFLEEWNRRESQMSTDTIILGQKAAQLEIEIQGIKDKIKLVSSPTVIKMLEDYIEKLQNEKTDTIFLRDKKEDAQLDVQAVINKTKFYMEHLHELLFGGENKAENAAMFGLLFETYPNYNDLKYGTPKLCSLFRLNEVFKESEEILETVQNLAPKDDN